MVCTSDLFARNADGKAEGLERVMIVLVDVSKRNGLVSSFRYAQWRLDGKHTFAGCAADLAG